MAHTLATLRARVQARSASNGADSLLTSAQLNDYVNRALAQMTVEEVDWPWQKVIDAAQVLAVGAQQFTPPAGWYRTASLTLKDTGIPLERRAPKYLDRVVGQGRPEWWAPDGAIIAFRYMADQNYTAIHRYYRFEPVLAADGDTPLIPEAYSQVVVEYAAYLALTQGNSVGRAAQALADFQREIRILKQHVNQSGEPLRITARPGGWL